MNAIELLLGWSLGLGLLGRGEEACLLMKLLGKWVNIIEDGLVLANKTGGTLWCPNEVITAAGDDVVVCGSSWLMRWRGHRLGGCVDIYREVLGKI
jgi:hypothetical protein